MSVSSPEQQLTELATPRLTRYIPHAPTEKQSAALVAHRFVEDPTEPIEIFYGGAAGGGKSDWLLMAGLQYVDYPSYAGIIFRRNYAQLSKPGALIARSKEWLRPTDAQWSEQRKEWTFPSGAVLAFGFLEHSGDEENYQSAEFQYIGFDELTHFDERQYVYMLSRLRRLEGVEIPLRQCAASNPGSRGHGWVRDRLVEAVGIPNRVFIPARLPDNPHLDEAAYMTSLSHLSPTLQQQLRDGDWNAFEGLAYSKFDRAVHVVPKFDVPAWWDRFEGHDHGSSNPCAWISFAADGDGNYLAHAGYYSPGLVSAHCAAILKRRETAGVGVCYADPSIRNTFGVKDWRGREISVELEYNDHGLFFAPGQNERRAGYLRLAELLRPDPDRYFPPWHPKHGQKGAPRLFFLDILELEPLIQQMRDAPLEDVDSPLSKHPGEAVDQEWESNYGHYHAAARYAAMSRQSPGTQPEQPPEDPRARLLWEHERREDPSRGGDVGYSR